MYEFTRKISQSMHNKCVVITVHTLLRGTPEGRGGAGRCRSGMTVVFQGTRAAPTAWDRRRAAVHMMEGEGIGPRRGLMGITALL